MSDLASSARASHWVVEMQLSLLREAYRGGEPDRKAVEAIASTLTRELSFLRGVSSLEAEQAKAKQALTEKEARSEAVDWGKFEAENSRQRLLLVDSYHGRNQPRNHAVQRLVPFLMDLTKTQPVNSAAVYPFPRVL